MTTQRHPQLANATIRPERDLELMGEGAIVEHYGALGEAITTGLALLEARRAEKNAENEAAEAKARAERDELRTRLVVQLATGVLLALVTRAQSQGFSHVLFGGADDDFGELTRGVGGDLKLLCEAVNQFPGFTARVGDGVYPMLRISWAIPPVRVKGKP